MRSVFRKFLGKSQIARADMKIHYVYSIQGFRLGSHIIYTIDSSLWSVKYSWYVRFWRWNTEITNVLVHTRNVLIFAWSVPQNGRTKDVRYVFWLYSKISTQALWHSVFVFKNIIVVFHRKTNFLQIEIKI